MIDIFPVTVEIKATWESSLCSDYSDIVFVLITCVAQCFQVRDSFSKNPAFVGFKEISFRCSNMKYLPIEQLIGWRCAFKTTETATQSIFYRK